MAVPAWLPVAASVASMVMGASGTAQAVSGANQAAAAARENASRRAAEASFEADQLRVNAGQEVAAGQAAAAEQRRQAVLTQSRAIAVAAAGGGSLADPTMVTLLARNAGEGVYRAGLALYQGNERARQMRMAAVGKDYEASADIAGGDAQAEGYRLRGQAEATRGVSSILGSASTLFSKYGGGGPTSAGVSAGASTDSFFAGADLAVG